MMKSWCFQFHPRKLIHQFHSSTARCQLDYKLNFLFKAPTLYIKLLLFELLKSSFLRVQLSM